jgi:UDP-N-acetylglucosamine 4,6-dehydratase/5-epimerase
MKNLLLVGGTGSFGQAYLSHLQTFKYQGRIRIFSRDEDKQAPLKNRFPDLDLEPVIGDVRDLESYKQAASGMDLVIHAAALKHVPVGELFTEEALKTNTQGVINCVKACQAKGVQKAIYLSTDKAVYPINAYGMTKALGEKIFQSKLSQDTDTVFCITRYGNVLGSRGSILPVIAKQVQEKNILQITDFAMTRFVMTLSQAVDLVNQAITLGKDGQLFIREVPACDLRTLVDGFLQYSYAQTLEEYGYKIVGIRPGEKIHEALATEEEMLRAHRQGEDIYCLDPYLQKELFQTTREEAFVQHPEALTSFNVKKLALQEYKALLAQAGFQATD